MKKIFLGLSAAAVFCSCKKDKTPVEPAETIYKIKTATVTNPTGAPVTFSYEYDAQNRLIKNLRGTGPRRTEFVYANTSITENAYNSSGVLDEIKTHELNSNGLVVKTTYSSSPGYYIANMYNTSQQLLSQKEYSNAGVLASTTDFFYTNQLLDSVLYKNATGIVIGKSLYSYYENIKNTIGNQHYGRVAFGRESAKAASEIHYYNYDYTTGAEISHELHTKSYETDAEGRIIKLILNYTGSSGSTVYTYTYY